jgi:uncharacterized protein YodC (DUF2158 family)
MDKATIHVGDVVHLRSGGPWMTVTATGLPGKMCQVAWFEQHGGLFSGAAGMNVAKVPAAALERKPNSVVGP